MDNEKSIGQLAFEVYNEQMGGVAFDGTPIPPWSNVRIEIKRGWHKAALRVLQFAVETRYSSTPEDIEV